MSVEVAIFDTTLRDGAQALPEAYQFPERSKSDIARHIASLGIDVIEAGFPITPGDAEEVRFVAETVGRTDYAADVWADGTKVSTAYVPPVIAGLSRTKISDIEATWDAVQHADRPRIHTFVSTDAEHMAAKFPGKTPEDVLRMGVEAVRHAREITADRRGASVEFSAEAATTTDPEYLERIIKEAVYSGADVINVPDTVGQRDPFWMYGFYQRVIDWAHTGNPDVTVSAHNHNDLDNATANSLALVRAASDYAATTGANVRVQLEGAICGLGERAGNADIFPVVGGLFKFTPDMATAVEWRFNPGESARRARMIMGFAGLTVDRQSPIVGADTNTHRAGIHSDGIIKGGHTMYTPYSPTFWGHEADAVHEDGRYQGRNGRQHISD